LFSASSSSSSRSWLAAWYVCFTFDTVYIKHVLDTVKMTDWGRVYYTNSLALGLLLLAFPFVGEWSYLQYNVWTMEQARALYTGVYRGVGVDWGARGCREGKATGGERH